jgi:hypothetical protein
MNKDKLYVAMIKIEHEYYLLSTSKGLIQSQRLLDDALESLKIIEHNTRIVHTDISRIVGKLLDHNMIIKNVGNYGLEMYATKCNNNPTIEEIYSKGIKPYTIRDVARDIIKELSREKLVKVEI